MYWEAPLELNKEEEKIAKRTRKGRKIFVFMREHRNDIISEDFEQKLIETYQEGGSTAALPGQLAMATLLQAYCNVSDKEAVELTIMDKRWQMVLNTLNAKEPPFSQRTLLRFRERLIAYNLDKELLNRTVEVAEKYGGFGVRQLRAVLDSSPLFGAARVEDTFNLLGHALTKAVTIVAKQLNKPKEVILEEAGLVLVGKSSIKAALDLDWGEADSKKKALTRIIEELDRWKHWAQQQAEHIVESPKLKGVMETIEQIVEQDTQMDANGLEREMKKEVAKDRRVSIEDKEMRHGRKSKKQRFNGFKEHLLGDMDSRVIKDVVVLPANESEYSVIDNLQSQLEPPLGLSELYIDLAYAAHPKILEWEKQGVNIIARPWPEKQRGVFSKWDFDLDFQKMTITCPAGKTLPIELGKVARYSGLCCNKCDLRDQCMTGKINKYIGRSIKIRHDEQIQQQRRAKIKTIQGREKIRKRVVIEHRISHQIASRGRKARYIGCRKNQFDGRRHAAINNLQLAQQYWQQKEKRAIAQ